MYKAKACILLLLLFLTGMNANPLKAFNNPLNNKMVDLFIVIDETNLYMNAMQLGLAKTALHNIVLEVNPVGSSPYFGMYFYGATTTVNILVPFTTNSALAVKAKLDQKQYAAAQANPSTLTTALNIVDSNCQTYCRPGVPRVMVVLSSTPDALAASTIRQLERNRGMTVIVVGIGFSASASVLSQLASHPTTYYAIPVATFYELILAASHIGSVISDVPRLLDFNIPFYIPSTSNGIYYTVQLNTYPHTTTTNDTIIMFSSNCISCPVYGSLSEPNPVSDNTVANIHNQPFFAATTNSHRLFYFRIPRSTGRFFLSFLGKGLSGVYIVANVFRLPDMMKI